MNDLMSIVRAPGNLELSVKCRNSAIHIPTCKSVGVKAFKEPPNVPKAVLFAATTYTPRANALPVAISSPEK